MQDLTLEDVKVRIAGLAEETQRKMVCALVGHSRLLTHFFGYHYCARCEAQVGDSLGGAFQDRDNKLKLAILGCTCEQCVSNYAAFDWKDTFLVPKEKLAEAESQFGKALKE